MNRQFIVLLSVLIFVVLLTTLVIKQYDPRLPFTEMDGAASRSSEIYAQLGRAFVSREQQDDGGCERLLRRVLELDSNNIYALSMLGELYLDHSRYEDAEEVFQQLTRLSPNSPAAYANLGMALSMEKKYEAAEKALRNSLALDDCSAAVHLHLAAVAAARKDFSTADEELSVAEKLMPKTLLMLPNAPHFNELLLYRTARRMNEPKSVPEKETAQ